MSPNHSPIVPNVLVVSWWPQDDSTFDTFLDQCSHLPAKVIHLDKNDPHCAEYLENNAPAACAAFISKSGLFEQSFTDFISACEKLILKRHDFRLFVQLAEDLNLSYLKTVPSAEKLIATVHLPNKPEPDISRTIGMIYQHLKELPRIKHRISRERSEKVLVKTLSVLTIFLILAFSISSALFPVFGLSLKNTIWFPWMFFGLGYLYYIGLVNLLTLFKPIHTGVLFRWLLLIATIYLVYSSRILLPFFEIHWPYFLAGGLLSHSTDIFNRFLVNKKRFSYDINDQPVSHSRGSIVPGIVTYGFVWTGPWFPQKTRVFISYSTKSEWGSQLAERLHYKFKAKGVACFYAPASIDYGSSWRHRLNSELADTSLFIQLLDEETSTCIGDAEKTMHWPAKELAVASKNQSVSALPTVAMVCQPEILKEDTCINMHPYIKKVLFEAPDSEISFLHIINYAPGIEDELVNEFSKIFRWNAVSILPLKMAAILDLLFMIPSLILATAGVILSVALWALPVAAAVSYGKNLDLLKWIALHKLELVVCIMLCYTLGFVLRFLYASYFEVWVKFRKNVSKWRIMEFLILVTSIGFLSPQMSLIGWIYGLISVSFGIVMGSFYLDMSEREKGWIKS